jgi:nitronate monooxygenase
MGLSHTPLTNLIQRNMNVVRVTLSSGDAKRRILERYPWCITPLIVGAPMRVMASPDLAVAVSKAGGLGFLGPGLKPEDTYENLDAASGLIRNLGLGSSSALPIGVGFQIWNDDVDVAADAIERYKPCAAWLFAPRHGQKDVDLWTSRLRAASVDTQIWLQVGTIAEATDAANSKHAPDVLVVQGAEAGGHGRAVDGIGIITLLPEIADAIHSFGIPLIAAGGIADGRGVVAAVGLGAAGIAMGTRFLAAEEARISKGYQEEVIRATDGASSTTRTMLYNHLRGTMDWPAQFSPRGITNRSYEDQKSGVPFDELKKLHDEAAKTGDAAWGPNGRVATYAGANVGLVRSVKPAEHIVKSVREDAISILESLWKYECGPKSH